MFWYFYCHYFLHLWLCNRPGVAGAVLQTPPPIVKISSKHYVCQTRKTRELKFWENVHPQPRVTCHVSCVKSHFFFLFFFRECCGASRWRVCYQPGLPRLVSSEFRWRRLPLLKGIFSFKFLKKGYGQMVSMIRIVWRRVQVLSKR